MISHLRHFMKLRVLYLALAASLFFMPIMTAAEPANYPVVAGLERMKFAEKLDVMTSGQLLLSELNCTSCHQTSDPAIGRKQAPILDQVGSRVHVSWLRKFLHDPQAVKPGT